jgi:hypothetical protein
MNTLIKLLRVLAPVCNKTAGELKGTQAGAWVGLVAIVLTAWVQVMDWYIAELPQVAPVILVPPVEAPAPDVQDEDTDASDILDVIDPPDAGGDLVVLSAVQVVWDDSYDPPWMNRRGNWQGGWDRFASVQRDYRRRGVR